MMSIFPLLLLLLCCPPALPTLQAKVTYEKHLLAGEPALEIHLLRLDRQATTLRVIPVAEGQSVAEGLQKAGALAGVNGGYFHRNRKPLGLVVTDGQQQHSLERAKLLSGLLVVTPQRAILLRPQEYKPGANTRQALQAGPFLIDRGTTVPGLNATKAAERTVLLADRNGVAALMTTRPVTLARLGELLALPHAIPGLRIERALNLDGGSSTALWFHTEPRPVSRPELKNVINAVAVVPIPPAANGSERRAVSPRQRKPSR